MITKRIYTEELFITIVYYRLLFPPKEHVEDLAYEYFEAASPSSQDSAPRPGQKHGALKTFNVGQREVIPTNEDGGSSA